MSARFSFVPRPTDRCHPIGTSRRGCAEITFISEHFFGCARPRPLRLAPRPSLIRLIDVYKAFGPKKVLQGFTLDVVEGETMVIIGYSGTGKSVAIKHIVGLLEPDSGRVLVDDLEVPRLS